MVCELQKFSPCRNSLTKTKEGHEFPGESGEAQIKQFCVHGITTLKRSVPRILGGSMSAASGLVVQASVAGIGGGRLWLVVESFAAAVGHDVRQICSSGATAAPAWRSRTSRVGWRRELRPEDGRDESRGTDPMMRIAT